MLNFTYYREKEQFWTIVLMAIYIASLALPCLLNWKKINPSQFIIGTIWNIFLAPTYVNIITTYAISNIHDISWGSRPSANDGQRQEQFERIERERELQYENYRSKFLLVWTLINTFFALIITSISRGDNDDIIFGIAAFMSGILFIKLLFWILFYFISWCSRVNEPDNDFFANAKEENELWEERQRWRIIEVAYQ